MRLFRIRRKRDPAKTGMVLNANTKLQPSLGRRFVALWLLIIIIAVLAGGAVSRQAHRTSTSSAAAVSATQPAPTVTVTQASQGSVSATTPTAPGCHRGSYTLPSPLSVSDRSPGIYTQIDTPASYEVFGGSTAGIMQQIARCTPVRSDGLFAANTGYSLSNYYTYGVRPNGLCGMTGVIVTLHVNQVYPNWRASSETAAMQTSWDIFIRNLRGHEQGHVDLDQQYANSLYDALQSMPDQNCGSFKSAADKVASRVMDQLVAANEKYDRTTKHGTTQGAVL
jgi:predicted secreted Zn-dependent protease